MMFLPCGYYYALVALSVIVAAIAAYAARRAFARSATEGEPASA